MMLSLHHTISTSTKLQTLLLIETFLLFFSRGPAWWVNDAIILNMNDTQLNVWKGVKEKKATC